MGACSRSGKHLNMINVPQSSESPLISISRLSFRACDGVFACGGRAYVTVYVFTIFNGFQPVHDIIERLPRMSIAHCQWF